MILILAALLDAALGEPKWLWSRLPHPAVLMGRAVGALEKRWNRGDNRKTKGIQALAVLITGAAVLGVILSAFGPVVQVIVAAILLAQKSLVDHVQAVADALRLSVGDGRVMVARIVSRDTAAMDGPDVARAAVESAAENLSDGVIAPAFWFLIGGLPGILIYKVVNTADSMVGYRNERFEDYGWASARCDDLLNWVPARLTALGFALAYGVRDWRGIVAEARRHKSPNAGWPEAALARAIGVALAGPRVYHGEKQDFPWVNPDGRRNIGADDIDAATRALWRVWGIGLAIVALATIL